MIKNVNSDTAKIEEERIVEAHPEYETDFIKAKENIFHKK